MKTRIQTFLMLLFVASLCCAHSLQAQVIINEATPVELIESAVPEIPPATIEFSETEFDFGTIEQGEIVSHVFTFTNTSDEVLILTNAKGSCGCTVPRWPSEPIWPGETASITVRFDSKGKKNKQNKKVTLTANTNPAQSFLYIKGEVIVPEEGDFEIAETRENKNETDALDLDCFAIYPNPTAEILKLDMKANIGKTAIISIYSKSGQLMAKREVEEVGETVEFMVDHYAPGTYIANVQIGTQKPVSQCFVVMD